MQATLRRHCRVEAPRPTVKARLEGTWAKLRALGSGAATLIGVHRH